MKNIAVFCGANSGKGDAYTKAAEDFGHLLATSEFALVYGGGSTGIMGAIADAVLEKQGKVIGVIPDFLVQKEIEHKGVQELITVNTMHERKQYMADISDAFVALPGGMGTMDELCEIITWSQLGLHHKPIGILNIDDYFTPLLHFFDSMVDKQFLSADNRKLIVSANDEKMLLELLKTYQAPQTEKWLDRDKT